MKVVNVTKRTTLGDNIKIANSFFSRFTGLMLKNKLSNNEGLIILPCKSIHMFFMRFPIDVVFVNKANKIIYLLESFRPWQISKFLSDSKYVIELPVGTIKNTHTLVGDIIEFER